MNTLASHIVFNQLKTAHTVLEQTMDGVTDEVAQFMPPGKANPIGSTYAHGVFTEDLFLHSYLKNTHPLYETIFKNKTGASEIQPNDWQEAYPKWLKEVRIDVKLFHEYAKAVFADSETFVASLTDADLEKEVDMSAFGMGMMKVCDVIANLISGHAYPIMGEISVLKGIQGLKGYPF